MNSFAVFLLALLPFCLGAATTKDPVVKLCKQDNPDLKQCWTDAASLIAGYIYKGAPSHNIPPISPLVVPRHEIKTPTFSGVFTNLVYDGFSTYTLRDVLPHATDNSVVFKILIKDLKLEGDLEATGTLEGIPFEGKGKIKIDFVNITYDGTLQWETFTIDGVKYHNVFGEATNVHYGLVELKALDFIKDADKLEAVKQKVREGKTADYFSVLEDTFIKHNLRYSLRAYNAVPVSD